MSEVKISAEPRTEFGKGGARRTRRAGMVPAVLYGHGEKPQHIALPAREFAAAIRKGGANQLFAIEVSNGAQVLALPKAIQRDPIRDTFEHVDLLLVRRGEKVTVEVPVQLTGEAARDTLIVHDHDTLSVTADATKVPDHLEASIEGAEAGTQITAGDVELPAGVELAVDTEMQVASVTAAPTAEQLEATLPEVEETAEEAEGGEEATEAAEGEGAAAEGEQTPAEAKTEA
ncbi:50S ribosomal protein L25/general stress protein Ctc [Micromonospora sp. DT31]|uniref:50S ribosomal protein L25/general stress protein Ctc n=1 Tax=Micromonospora sp. DT31 TaxID=3393434 RepID=UPI003CE77537